MQLSTAERGGAAFRRGAKYIAPDEWPQRPGQHHNRWMAADEPSWTPVPRAFYEAADIHYVENGRLTPAAVCYGLKAPAESSSRLSLFP